MAHVKFDRVKETTTTTGTGTVTLAGAVSGFATFTGAGVANGDTVHYAIVGGTEWETGIGTYTTSGTTLARTTPLAGSAATPVNFSAGTKEVFLTVPAAKTVQFDHNNAVLFPKMTVAAATPAAGFTQFYSVDDDGTTRFEYMNSAGETVRLARDNVLTVRNQTGANLTKGELVYINDANSSLIRVAKAKADSDTTSPAMGMMMDTVTNGNNGRVMLQGLVSGLTTTGLTEGQPLYLSAATAGAYQNTVPSIPSFKQRIGFVVNVHASTGSILVAPVGQAGRFDAAGNILLPVLTFEQEPSTPAANLLAVYGRYKGGRAMLKQKGPSGLDTALQPFLGGNSIHLVSPNTTTSVSTVGGAVTSVGTLSTPAVSATSFGISTQFASAATANTGAGTSQNLAYLLRGNGTAGNASGWHVSARWWAAVSGDLTNALQFIGLSNGTITNMTAAAAPSQQYVGAHYHTGAGDSRTTKYGFVLRNAGTVTVVDTNITVTALNLYNIDIFCPPYAGSGQSIYLTIENLSAGTSFSHEFANSEGQMITNTTLLRSMATGGTTEAVAKNFRFKKLYTETDF